MKIINVMGYVIGVIALFLVIAGAGVALLALCFACPVIAVAGAVCFAVGGLLSVPALPMLLA